MISTNPYKNLNKFSYHTAPMKVTDKGMDKWVIKGLEISQEGKSSGVLFVECPEGGVVIKCTNQTPTDYFFNLLAQKLDLNVPHMRVLSCYEEEFEQLVFAVESYCAQDEVLYARIKNKLDYPFYQVIQYVPSIWLAHTGSAKFQHYMLAPAKMYALGMCLGFDLIINNSDRMQLVSRGEGNIKNILLSIDPTCTQEQIRSSKDRQNLSIQVGNYVFIDHDGHMLDEKNREAVGNLNRYMEKVTEFQLQMVMFLRKEGHYPECFKKLIGQFAFFTQYEFSTEDIRLICEGIVYCTSRFLDLFQRKQLHELYQSLLRNPHMDESNRAYWDQYWDQALKKVHLSFAETYYIKISAIYTTYPELIQEIVEKVSTILGKQKPEYKPQQNTHQPVEDTIISKDKPLEEEQQQEEGKRRKWKQKLETFKNKNYE